jgi:hypothetical protein
MPSGRASRRLRRSWKKRLRLLKIQMGRMRRDQMRPKL